LWCGGGHLHRDCPEKGNASSTLACCNCQLAKGETVHPANYRGYRHAKEEMRKKKPQGTSKSTTGRVFPSTFIKPHLSFTAALRGQVDQLHQEAVASTSKPEPPKQNQNKKKQVSQVQLPL
jgi:hypothetical protein